MRKLASWLQGEQRSLVLITVALLGVAAISSPLLSPDGFGFHSGSSVVKKTVIRISENETEEITVTEGSGKTVWDWLSLLGVPLALAVFGFWFQKAQQEQSERLSKEQREQEADETREEVLQLYFDRISTLLIDKNLMAIAANRGNVDAKKEELLEASIDVIKARTLSILRRFEKDLERRDSVLRFLAEADVISRLRIALSSTNLHDINLFGVNLGGAGLSGANLNNADLGFANLNNADLSNANLSGAVLSRADLSNANLRDANLHNTDLLSARNLTKDQLSEALLCNTQLPKNIDLDPNRDCQKLGITPQASE